METMKETFASCDAKSNGGVLGIGSRGSKRSMEKQREQPPSLPFLSFPFRERSRLQLPNEVKQSGSRSHWGKREREDFSSDQRPKQPGSLQLTVARRLSNTVQLGRHGLALAAFWGTELGKHGPSLADAFEFISRNSMPREMDGWTKRSIQLHLLGIWNKTSRQHVDAQKDRIWILEWPAEHREASCVAGGR
jgi:hypothetical protein